MLTTYNTNKHLAEIELRLNSKLDKQIYKIERWADYGKGNPQHLMAGLVNACTKMDDLGFDHIAFEEIRGYTELEAACSEDRRRRRQLRR